MKANYQTVSVPYVSPRVLAEEIVENTYDSVIWVVIAVSMVLLLGGLAICLSLGYDGIAFQVSIDQWTVKLGCVKNS
jgi:hypothetical protein